MTDVISAKFKNRGKCYFFDPGQLQINDGDKVIVETAKGLEMADCCRGNHPVPETAVVQPLRPVIRAATEDDMRVAAINKKREKEAFEICQKKIAEHKLDMKLVDVECNFEGNKTTFFFTSDGRVDFRELVKDLAGIFRNRIELRQIGVRDEAKMIGGIGICGRPYCCSQFLNDFQPVSTKMAKIQNLSLNPAKISGSCGRLMCCLRYEQEAYEDLIKKVPKQGAFVETKDGYGTAVQVNLLQQTVKVKLDEDGDDTLRLFKANELAAVPGGRPKEGEPLPHVLHYVPEPEEEKDEESENEWNIPLMYGADTPEEPEKEKQPEEKKKTNSRRRRRSSRPRQEQKGDRGQSTKPAEKKAEGGEKSVVKPNQSRKPRRRPDNARKGEARRQTENAGKATVKPVKKAEAKPKTGAQPAQNQQKSTGTAQKNNRRRRYYGSKSKSKSEPKE